MNPLIFDRLTASAPTEHSVVAALTGLVAQISEYLDPVVDRDKVHMLLSGGKPIRITITLDDE